MKSKLLALLLVLTLTACEQGGKRVKTVVTCPEETRQERAAFIIECAKAANPLSDEEGEDLVNQCERTAGNLYCEETIEIITCYSRFSGTDECYDRDGKLTSKY